MKSRYLVLFLSVLLLLAFTLTSWSKPTMTKEEKVAIQRYSQSLTVSTGTIPPTGNSIDEVNIPVTIGDGLSTQGMPSYDWYMGEFDQIMLLASEITAAGGSAGQITHVRYYCGATKTWPARTQQIWMQQTAATALVSTDLLTAVTGATEVYNVSNWTGPTATGWWTFDITDFTWNGTSNLIISMWSYRPNYSNSSPVWCYTTEATGMLHANSQQDMVWPHDGNLTYVDGDRPNMQLEMMSSPPGAPVNPIPANAATNIGVDAQLSWSTGGFTNTYDVYFGTTTPATNLVSAAQVGTTYNPGALTPNTWYYWRVDATNFGGTAVGSEWSFQTGAGAAPNPPTDGYLSGIGETSMTMNWTDNSSDETAFNVYRSTDGATFSWIADTAPNTLFYVDNTLSPSTSYWYRVFASNGVVMTTGYASANNISSAAVPDAPTAGTPTGGMIPITVNNNSTTPNSAATVYAIRVNGTQFVQINGTLGGTPVWRTLALWGTPVNVTGLTPNTSYTFDVAARNANNVVTASSAALTVSTANWTPNAFLYSPATLPVALLDVTTVDVPIVVENYGMITDVDLTFTGTHTYTADMYFELIHPDATTVPLFASRGGSGDDFTNTVFDDEASVAISAGLAPFTGSWIPESPLNAFDGKPASGTWILRCIDQAGGDTGWLTTVQLGIAATDHPATNPNGEGSTLPYTVTPPADPLTGNNPPLVIEFPAQTGGSGNPGTVTTNVYYEVPSGNPAQLPPSNTINRYWDIQTSSVNFENATLRLRFTTADLPAGITDPMTANPPIMSAYSVDGGLTWNYVTGTVVDLGGGVYEMVITGLNHFSLWALGNGGILPVELSAFTASSADRQVVLNWRTETETNNDFFRVYRSLTAADRGELVGVVDGMGNNQTTHNYRFVDSRVVNGVTYYYRLADVDLNGIEALHPSVVNATPAAGARGVVPSEYALEQNMPNPFNPTTEIRYAVKEAGLVTLKVFDITGREVATLVDGNYPANSYRISFDATTLSAGVYFYQIRVNDFYAVRKMVVAK